MPDLLLVHARCHHCGTPYAREIEPEWAEVVRKFGICDGCYDLQEQARCMEVEDGAA